MTSLTATCEQEEELASNRSDDDLEVEDDEDEDDIASEPRPEDKENALPTDASNKPSDRPKGRTGRKRKRQTATKARRQAQDTGATRRQRIRQYYNGATHGSASAVQLFAMAMQVRPGQGGSPFCKLHMGFSCWVGMLFSTGSFPYHVLRVPAFFERNYPYTTEHINVTKHSLSYRTATFRNGNRCRHRILVPEERTNTESACRSCRTWYLAYQDQNWRYKK